jgi:SAM-dependent methyltransferase
MMPAAEVVNAYKRRARFAAEDTVAVQRPRLLRGLLCEAAHVAEIPCGAGHFLTEYARTGCAATLVDASPEMLAVAMRNAVEAGLPTDRTFPVVAFVQELGFLADVDLLVVPNGALNQLVCQSRLISLLASLHRAIRPGTTMLTQVVCTHGGQLVDTATFYDAAFPHGAWFIDRFLDPVRTDGAVFRQRRQHRRGSLLHIEFAYCDEAGASLGVMTAELELLSALNLAKAFAAAGFTDIRFVPGHGGPSEVVATSSAPGEQP